MKDQGIWHKKSIEIANTALLLRKQVADTEPRLAKIDAFRITLSLEGACCADLCRLRAHSMSLTIFDGPGLRDGYLNLVRTFRHPVFAHGCDQHPCVADVRGVCRAQLAST